MLDILVNLRRGIRTALRAFWASVRGPQDVHDPAAVTVPKSAFMHRDPDEMHVRVHFDKDAYNCIKKFIGQAKKSIEIQTFIWVADDVGKEVAGMLVHAANRGVRVLVRKEMVGDVFEFHQDFVSTKNDPDPVWQEFWRHPLIAVLHENRHDHSKTFIIDDETFLVGSMNIGDSFCNEWHENLVELHGADFIHQFHANGTKLAWPLQEGVTVVRSTPALPMMDVVVPLLEGATTMIQMEMAYFSDPRIADLIVKKSHEGVYIFILFPHSVDLHHHANMATAVSLLKSARKNRMFISRYPRSLMHAKFIIVDGQTLFIGSTNLIASSLRKMGETNVVIHRRPRSAIREARRRFTKDSVRSIEITKYDTLRLAFHTLLSWFRL